MNQALKRSMDDGLRALMMQPCSCLNAQTVSVSDELSPALKIARPAFIQLLLSLFLLTGALWALPASAQEAQNDDLTRITAQSKEDSSETFPVEFMNRQIFTVRTGFMGFTSEERAMGIRNRIKMAMEKGGDDHVSIRPAPEGGRLVELNGLAVFQVRPSDIDPTLGESIDEAANNAAQNLKIAVREAREQGNTKVMLKGAGLFSLASALPSRGFRARGARPLTPSFASSRSAGMRPSP